jgi:alpha-glucosidase (family GH31 glycosyl hydrolase)
VKQAADHVPVYVRAGAFIPMAQVVQTTRDYSTKNIELHYYHDASVRAGAGKLYDDDGLTAQAYEQGKYELLHFASKLQSGALSLRIESEVGKQYQRPERAIALHVHNVAAKPGAVRIDGKVAVYAWDADSKLLTVDLPASEQAARSIDIAL